jgi:hypothetical protein
MRGAIVGLASISVMSGPTTTSSNTPIQPFLVLVLLLKLTQQDLEVKKACLLVVAYILEVFSFLFPVCIVCRNLELPPFHHASLL